MTTSQQCTIATVATPDQSAVKAAILILERPRMWRMVYLKIPVEKIHQTTVNCTTLPLTPLTSARFLRRASCPVECMLKWQRHSRGRRRMKTNDRTNAPHVGKDSHERASWVATSTRSTTGEERPAPIVSKAGSLPPWEQPPKLG